MRRLKKMNEALCKMETVFNSLVLMIVLAVISAQIVMRYVFNRPLIWSEELSRYLYVWIAWIGCAYCVGTKSHISVPIFSERLPVGVRKVLTGIGNIIVIGFLLYLIPYSFSYALGQRAFAASTLPLKRIWLYLPLPIGIWLSVIQLIIDTILFIADEGKGGNEE